MAMKDNGGVVQIVAFSGYVKIQPQRIQAMQDLRAEFGIERGAQVQQLSEQDRQRYEQQIASITDRWPRANVANFVDHIDYAVDLIGIDHVGISSDFDGGGGIDGWNSAEETFNITLELVSRGYSEGDIARIWGQNLLRILQQAEDVAASY